MKVKGIAGSFIWGWILIILVYWSTNWGDEWSQNKYWEYTSLGPRSPCAPVRRYFSLVLIKVTMGLFPDLHYIPSLLFLLSKHMKVTDIRTLYVSLPHHWCLSVLSLPTVRVSTDPDVRSGLSTLHSGHPSCPSLRPWTPWECARGPPLRFCAWLLDIVPEVGSFVAQADGLHWV